MKKYLIAGIVFGLVLGLYPVGDGLAAPLANNYDFGTAVELSRIMDRQLVFSFMSATCPHCQEYKEKILSAPEVKEVLDDHFVLSLVSVDRTFELELPEEGTMTNMELASGLGIKGTPTTFVFYPPDPGLLRGGRGITKFQGSPPEPGMMTDFLNRVVTEQFKESEGEGQTEEGRSFYNYEPRVKSISRDDLDLMREAGVGLPVVSEEVETSSLPDAEELVLDLTGGRPRDFAKRILAETGVKKVYVVEQGS